LRRPRARRADAGHRHHQHVESPRHLVQAGRRQLQGGGPMMSAREVRAERAARFRALHYGPRVLVLANAWDALSAHVVESSGASAIATASAALAWAHGCADGEIMSLDALVSAVHRITSAVSLPVTVDLEAGWSDDPGAVVEAVTRIAEAG